MIADHRRTNLLLDHLRITIAVPYGSPNDLPQWSEVFLCHGCPDCARQPVAHLHTIRKSRYRIDCRLLPQPWRLIFISVAVQCPCQSDAWPEGLEQCGSLATRTAPFVRLLRATRHPCVSPFTPLSRPQSRWWSGTWHTPTRAARVAASPGSTGSPAEAVAPHAGPWPSACHRP